MDLEWRKVEDINLCENERKISFLVRDSLEVSFFQGHRVMAGDRTWHHGSLAVTLRELDKVHLNVLDATALNMQAHRMPAVDTMYYSRSYPWILSSILKPISISNHLFRNTRSQIFPKKDKNQVSFAIFQFSNSNTLSLLSFGYTKDKFLVNVADALKKIGESRRYSISEFWIIYERIKVSE